MRRRNRVERLTTGRGGLAAWRGFALVAVMWMLAALALLVAGLSLVQPRSGAWRKEAEHGRI